MPRFQAAEPSMTFTTCTLPADEVASCKPRLASVKVSTMVDADLRRSEEAMELRETFLD